MIEKVNYKKEMLALIVRGRYINKKGIRGIKLSNYPKTFGSLLNLQTGVIQLTTQAVLEKSKHKAYLALLADPVVTSVNNAEKLLNNMISAQHKYLSYLN